MAQKNALDEKLTRILIILAAIVLGAGVTLGLSYMGNIADGPVGKLFDKIGEMTRSAEERAIISQRTDARSNKLQWFKDKRTMSYLRDPETILVGAHDNHTNESFESIISLEDSLRTTFPLIHFYVAWGSRSEHEFPKLQVQAIINTGSVPVITWEPWLTDFDSKEYAALKPKDLRSTNGLDDVAAGAYDLYIQRWADAVKKVNSPIFIRLGHEMNDPYRYPWGPQNNTPQSFVNAWRHIHDLFAQAGVTNVLWVWNPSLSYQQIDEYYPGDDYTDYVGVDILNFGTVATWSAWYSFEQIFSTRYESIAAHKKPIMIAEFGSLACGGDRKEWFAEALDSLPQKYPAVRSVMFFHVSDDQTTTMQPLSWYFKYDTASTHVIADELKKWQTLSK